MLSNLVNARYLRICVLTQYKSPAGPPHLAELAAERACRRIHHPGAAQRLEPRWYTGSADAIYQSLNLIYDEDPDYLVVFGADHVMDPEMVKSHRKRCWGHGCRNPGAARRSDGVRLHRRR